MTPVQTDLIHRGFRQPVRRYSLIRSLHPLLSYLGHCFRQVNRQLTCQHCVRLQRLAFLTFANQNLIFDFHLRQMSLHPNS